MKKLMFLLLLMLSCEKEQKYCWDCELTSGYRVIPMPWIYTYSQIVYCDKTEDEIAQIIKDHEYSKGMGSLSSMTCTKRK